MKHSRTYLVAASLSVMSATFILAGTASSNAQSAGPFYSNTIHQSAGERDSRDFPKYYEHANARRSFGGAYASVGGPSGNRDNTLPQSEIDFQAQGNPGYKHYH